MRHRLLIASSLLLAACGAPPTGDGLELDSIEQSIVNGQVSEATDDDSAVYVRTRWDNEAVTCTGTLVAPNLVATALHCITETPSAACTSTARQCFTCNPDGSLVEDNGLGHIGPLTDPAGVNVTVGSRIAGVEPSAYGQQLIGSGSAQICRGDIGFIVLDRDLDAPITRVRLDYGVKPGDTVTIMGYGETETSGTSGRRMRSGVRITEVGPASEDEPTISASPRTFVVNEGPCHGDSGGPALAEDTGALVGVYSLTAGELCTGVGVRNIYTSLSLFSSVAREAFEAAGAEPLIDPLPPEPAPPELVPEGGCTLNDPNHPGYAGSALLLALAGLGLIRRRRA